MMPAMEKAVERGGDAADVLSKEEEELLATLRRMVCGVRAHYAELELATLVKTLLSAGARQEEEGGQPGFLVFSMGSVRFTLTRPAGHPGEIEVSFVNGRP